ncbi:hypothetical protein ACS0TY_034564 [Phlomoides rotata]
MSCFKAGFSVDFVYKNRAKGSFRVNSSFQTLQFKESSPTEFWNKTLTVLDQKPISNFIIKSPNLDPLNAQTSLIKWWEKSLHMNMIEIQSAQQLVDCLLNAGNRLVVLEFYSPGCGGCKTLHPKMCQIAETNPNSIFVKVNYEQHKSLCYALNVHVLPFFRFYRGADGRACSFSCTNATIKKFKDALAKHGSDSGQDGPAKGLDSSEISTLASMGLITRNLAMDDEMGDLVSRETPFVMA